MKLIEHILGGERNETNESGGKPRSIKENPTVHLLDVAVPLYTCTYRGWKLHTMELVILPTWMKRKKLM